MPTPGISSELFEILDTAIKEKKLTELHTHLLGMGSPDFWIEKVICDFIPKKVKEKNLALEYYEDDKYDYPIPFYTNQVTQEFLSTKRCTPDLKEKLKTKNLPFTSDVVYQISTFLKICSQPDQNGICNFYGLKRLETLECIVFNARIQKFEYREGISNTTLIDYFKTNEKFKKQFRNCFAMLSPEGNKPEEATIRTSFQNRFDPEFYPRRFILKDDIYSQYLDTLDILLEYVLERYETSGVSYVEFSVGFNDLVKRPWVTNNHLFKKAEEWHDRVKVRYLVGFGRDVSVPFPVGFRKKIEELFELENISNDDKNVLTTILKESLSNDFDPCKFCLEPVLYQPFIKMLEDLKPQLLEPKRQKFLRYIVGFDYMSNEKNYPFCPFALDDFINVLVDCRKENKCFGFRFHFGEMYVGNSISDFQHVAIGCKIIQRILDRVPKSPDIPLRIGHGLALASFYVYTTLPKNLQYPIINDICETIKLLKDWRIPIEINLRSNELLVQGALNNMEVVETLSKLNIPLFLCTDDDGIWNVEFDKYISVAAEYAKAIDSKTLDTTTRLKNMIQCAFDSRFNFNDFHPKEKTVIFLEKLINFMKSKQDVNHPYYEFFSKYFAGNMESVRSRMDTLEILKDEFVDVDVKTGLKNLLESNNVRLLKTVADFSHTLGDYSLKVASYRRLLELEPNNVIFIGSLGNALREDGKYDEALPLLKQALKNNQELLDPEHPDTLTSKNNLALLYNNQGKYDKAEPLFIDCFELRKKVLGSEHPDTLNSMNNLAVLYYYQGKYDKAEPLYIDSFELKKKVLGSEHPDTLSSMNNLANLYNNQGKYDKAEPLYIDCLELRKKVLGSEHPDTLSSMNNLALLYNNQGKYEKAEPLYIDCLELRKKVLGTEHPDTLTSMNDLAVLYYFQGKYDKAEPLYIDCFELKKKVLGSEHPDTLTSMNNLALLYNNQGKYDKAEPLYIDCLELSKKVLGSEHPNTLTSMNNLANLYKNKGKYDKAEPLYIDCLELRKKVLGSEHPNTLNSMNNLAVFYKNKGK